MTALILSASVSSSSSLSAEGGVRPEDSEGIFAIDSSGWKDYLQLFRVNLESLNRKIVQVKRPGCVQVR